MVKRFILAGLCFVAAAAFAIQQPVGLYRLFTVDQSPEGDGDLSNDNCDGLRLQLSWATMEPSEATYIWNTSPVPADCSGSGGNILDRTLCVAKANKKAVGIAVAGGANAPDWLYSVSPTPVYKFLLDAADQTVNGNSYMPVIWQPIYQTKAHNFITALAAHIATRQGKEQIRYIITSFVAKQIDMRTWCQNFDQSVVVTDGVLTNSGAYCKIDSSTAHFLTHADQTSGSVVGKVIADTTTTCVNGGSCTLRPNSIVCNIASDASCPADPTDGTVYVNRNAFITGSGKTIGVLEWLPNKGEFNQLDQIAISPPGGYGFVSNANGMTGADGAYVAACEAIVGLWATEFAGYNVILTRSAPYATAQGQTDSSTINAALQATWGDQYGTMSVSSQAECPPQAYNLSFASFPHGSQAISPSAGGSFYAGGACPFKGPYPIFDMIAARIDPSRADKYIELYDADMDSINPNTVGVDANMVSLAKLYRSRMRFGNPQAAQRARVVLKKI